MKSTIKYCTSTFTFVKYDLKVSISLGNLDVGLSIKIGVNLPPNLSYQTPLTSRVQVASCEKRRLKNF